MIVIIRGPIVKCKKCFMLYDLEPGDFGEPERSSDERNMGYETQYTWEYAANCERCDNDMNFVIEGYEYPQGVLNYDEFSSHGCIMIENPRLEIAHSDDHDGIE